MHEGLVQTIAYYLIRPTFESILERYIEKNGLFEYVKQHEQKSDNHFNFYEITEGTGSKALCGQEVALQINKISNISIPQKASDIVLKIGEDKLKEVGLGAIGMREGGERAVLINNGTNIDSYYVKLIKIIDKYPNSVSNLMIFDNLTNSVAGKVKCGDEVSVKYSVTKYNGALQIETKEVKFKIGAKEVPLAMELGVIGMTAGNNRTVIAFPDALTITNEMLIKDIDFDKENISIINLKI